MNRTILATIFLASCLLLPAASSAQNFTTVSMTVTDPNGLPYSFGVVSAVLSPSAPGGYTLGGFPYSGQLPATSLDVNGSVTVSMGSNTAITPGGSQWLFSVTIAGIQPPQGTGPQSFTSLITISGATQNISTTLSAAAPALSRSTGATFLGGSIIDASARTYGLKADAQWVVDATFNGTSTVTTGASDPCFVAATDVGKQIEGTTWNGNDVQYISTSLSLPETTIAAVNSCHSATVTAGTPGACAAVCTLGWGTKNDTAIAAIWSAAVANPGLCKSIWWPSGGIWLDSTQFNIVTVQCNTPITAPTRQGLQFMGQGGHEGNTVFVLGSTFNLSGCVTDCFFHGLAGIKLSSFSMFGLGTPSMTGVAPSDFWTTGFDTEVDDVEMAGMLATTQTNFTCVSLNNIDVRWLIVDGCGSIALQTTNHVGMHQSFFGNVRGGPTASESVHCNSGGGYHVESHGSGYSLANVSAAEGIYGVSGCTWVSEGEVFVQSTPTNGVCAEALAGAVFDLTGFTCTIQAGTTTTALWAHGGKIVCRTCNLGGSSQAVLSDNTTGLYLDATPGVTSYNGAVTATSPACVTADSRFLACVQTAGNTANIAATTLFATPSGNFWGTYRLDYDVVVNTAGTAGTITVNLICNNGVSFTQAGAQTVAVTAAAGTETSGTIACHAVSLTNVQYSVSGITTPGALSYTLILRLLAQ